MATAARASASSTAEVPTSHTQNQNETRPEGTFEYTRAEQIEALHKLREPFKPEEIRYLPRMWCGHCKNSGGKGCQQHPRRKCPKCGQNMPGGHIDLRFVGHAEATNRLLNVDPFWDWEPLSADERGLPQVDGYAGLWIRLTVCGMTRLGYGHADGKTGGDAVKETIGDAIRNAGMRFGMALNLWTSSDLEIVESGEMPVEGAEASTPAPQASAGENHVARLVDQAKTCWANAIALTQVLADAGKHHVADEEVDGPNGRQTLRALLNDRIAQLKAATGGDTERSAA
ncbi:hypothetical protein ACFRCX_30155 [Streptomyces sp. NPDC056652]|uniref:hypothetical protein n=1 Tax=Streptomyces sp. NPDC056652 TaxID=3345893 RepID=UPI0036927454